jgi:hypothetical protein
MWRSRSVLVLVMILLATASRLIPHPPNFTPIGALALIAGACSPSRLGAFAVPLSALLVSDVALAALSGDISAGFHRLMPFVYGSFALIVLLGLWLRSRRAAASIAGATLAGSVLFFLVTNFGVWLFSSRYAKSAEGLLACYAAAIPFFRNTVLGDACYAAALFGAWALAEKTILAPAEAAPARSR